MSAKDLRTLLSEMSAADRWTAFWMMFIVGVSIGLTIVMSWWRRKQREDALQLTQARRERAAREARIYEEADQRALDGSDEFDYEEARRLRRNRLQRERRRRQREREQAARMAVDRDRERKAAKTATAKASEAKSRWDILLDDDDSV